MSGYYYYLFPFVFLSIPIAVALLAVGAGLLLLRSQRRHAQLAGYPSLVAYLRAAPRTDEEKRRAVDLALKGLAICMLGFIFSPLLLIGLFPFFYGVRKVMYGSMGLGLIDDTDQPAA